MNSYYSSHQHCVAKVQKINRSIKEIKKVLKFKLNCRDKNHKDGNEKNALNTVRGALDTAERENST